MAVLRREPGSGRKRTLAMTVRPSAARSLRMRRRPLVRRSSVGGRRTAESTGSVPAAPYLAGGRSRLARARARIMLTRARMIRGAGRGRCGGRACLYLGRLRHVGLHGSTDPCAKQPSISRCATLASSLPNHTRWSLQHAVHSMVATTCRASAGAPGSPRRCMYLATMQHATCKTQHPRVANLGST